MACGGQRRSASETEITSLTLNRLRHTSRHFYSIVPFNCSHRSFQSIISFFASVLSGSYDLITGIQWHAVFTLHCLIVHFGYIAIDDVFRFNKCNTMNYFSPEPSFQFLTLHGILCLSIITYMFFFILSINMTS